MMKKRLSIVHPYLFAIWPVLFLFSHNLGELPLRDGQVVLRLLVPMLVFLGLALFLNGVSAFIFQNSHAAGLMSSLCILLFFSHNLFSAGYSFVAERYLQREALLTVNPSFVIGPNKIYLAICLGLMLLGGWLLRGFGGDLSNVTRFANVTVLFLVLISLGNIAQHEMKRFILNGKPKAVSSSFSQEIEGAAKPQENVPDIYYIILDAYASQNTLQEFYAYDNHPFLEGLRQRGFMVASKSFSNYAFTTLSLPSALEMNFLDDWAEHLGKDSKDVTPMIDLMSNNHVMRFLKEQGYEIVHFSAPSMMTEQNSFADRIIDCNQGVLGDRFLRELFQMTLLASISQYLPYQEEFEHLLKRQRVQCKFQQLAHIKESGRPKFIFAHILAPHFPYVFMATGGRVTERERNTHDAKQLYVNQLRYINIQVETLLDRLLSLPEEKHPIIILQADHGPWNTDNWQGSDLYTTRMGILNAYYFPQRRYSLLYESISPVNSFRVIFNTYFGTQYSLLADESYYSWYEKPYQFVNISEFIRERQ